MCPKEAKVFLVEDQERYRDLAHSYLEEAGHKVVAETKTLKEALELIPSLKEKGVNVAVVDGNLSPNDVSGKDGLVIARQIIEEAPEIKIIAYSLSCKAHGDVFVSKKESEKLGEEVTKL